MESRGGGGWGRKGRGNGGRRGGRWDKKGRRVGRKKVGGKGMREVEEDKTRREGERERREGGRRRGWESDGEIGEGRDQES